MRRAPATARRSSSSTPASATPACGTTSGAPSPAAGIGEAAPVRVSALVLAGSGLPGHEWSDPVREYWKAEEAAIERGDLAAAAEVNVRFRVDGPRRRPDAIDPDVRRRAYAMQLRARAAGAGVRARRGPRGAARARRRRPPRRGASAGPRSRRRGRPAGHPRHRLAARDRPPRRPRGDDPGCRPPPEHGATRALRPARGGGPQPTGLSDRAIASISGFVRSSSRLFCTQ
jgi:hypothetical protein